MKRALRFLLCAGIAFITAAVLGAAFQSVLLTFALLVVGITFAVRRSRAPRSMVPTREEWRAHLRKRGMVPFDVRPRPTKWPAPRGMLF